MRVLASGVFAGLVDFQMMQVRHANLVRIRPELVLIVTDKSKDPGPDHQSTLKFPFSAAAPAANSIADIVPKDSSVWQAFRPSVVFVAVV
jgi:hypothetical protein